MFPFIESLGVFIVFCIFIAAVFNLGMIAGRKVRSFLQNRH
jgi:hypothetical protein